MCIPPTYRHTDTFTRPITQTATAQDAPTQGSHTTPVQTAQSPPHLSLAQTAAPWCRHAHTLLQAHQLLYAHTPQTNMVWGRHRHCPQQLTPGTWAVKPWPCSSCQDRAPHLPSSYSTTFGNTHRSHSRGWRMKTSTCSRS